MTLIIIMLGVVAGFAWTSVLWDVAGETRWGIRVYLWWSNRRTRRD